MSVMGESGRRTVKKGEKRCGIEMKTEIYFTQLTHQPCWLSLQYNNQLEQKGLKRTLISLRTCCLKRSEWDSDCNRSIHAVKKKIKLINVFHVYVLDMKMPNALVAD